MMTFPRPTIKVGKCIAILQTHYTGKGKPLLQKRPVVKFKGESWIASRLSYHLNNNKIPRSPAVGNKGQGGVVRWKSKQILHTCNHIWCIKPQHLYEGGHKENGFDRWRDTTKIKRLLFKEKMKSICNDPIYIANMKNSTKGIRKTKQHKIKIGLGQKRVWSDPKYHTRMCKVFTGIPKTKRS